MKIKNSCCLLGYFLVGLTMAVIAQKNSDISVNRFYRILRKITFSNV